MSERIVMPTHGNFKDRTGQKHYRWTVTAFNGRRGKYYTWLCKCDCGTERVLRAKDLGVSRSCGCYHREVMAQANTIHRSTGTAEHRAWQKIKQRCFNKNQRGYKNYGGRGIVVCERWKNSFECFLEDMGAKPHPLHEIDRIDNSGHYSCGHCAECLSRGWRMNCRWISRKGNNRNKRTNRWITYKGETLCLRDWCLRTGIAHATLSHRLSMGLPLDVVFTKGKLNPWIRRAR